jgi:predicted Rossmann fold nucleotide-binding protein DprA/Smf involved in DNA uptake
MRELLEQKRREVAAQMVKLEAKLAVYDELLAELSPVVVPSLTVPTEALQSFVPTKLSEKPYNPRPRQHRPVVETIELALEAAGEEGITAKQLAEVASIPGGTISGRLSMMKSEGRVRHVGTRYFAVHSKTQDNNDDQGIES